MNQFMIPHPLLIYDSLSSRGSLSPNQRKYYNQLQKGYLGEKKLASIIKEIPYQNFIPLFNCLFEISRTELQIDCLLITANTIYLLEIKNYTGDYYVHNNHVYHLQSHKEIYNPLTQIERATFLLKKLLNELNNRIEVKPYVVFVNDDFYCYKVSQHLPFIFPHQIERFLNKINEASPRYPDTEMVKKILSRTKLQSKYELLPKINKETIARGIFCPSCHQPVHRHGKFKLQCGSCGKIYNRDFLILRTISEFHLLFPEEKMTLERIRTWSGDLFSRNFFYRFLKKYFKMSKNGRYTYYEFIEENKHLEILSEKFK